MDEAWRKEFGIIKEKPVIDPLHEPDFIVRSKKNTYIEDTSQLLGSEKAIERLYDSKFIGFCDDILLATRRRGFSVEKFFQQYGSFNKYDG